MTPPVREKVAALPDTVYDEQSVPLRSRLARAAADVASIVLAFVACYLLYIATIDAGGAIHTTLPSPDRYAAIMLLHVVFTIAVFMKMGLYGPRASVLNLWELERVTNGLFISSAFLIASMFMLKIEGLSRLVVTGSLLSSLVTIVVMRRLISVRLRTVRAKDERGLRVLIVGCGDMGRLLMKKLVDAPHVHRAIVGFLDRSLPIGQVVSCTTDQSTQNAFSRPVLGTPDDLRVVVAAYDVQEVLVDGAALSPAALRDVLRTGRELGLLVGVVPDFADVRSDELMLEDLSAIPVLRPRSSADRRLYRRMKRVFDVLGAAALLLLSAPIWMVAALGLRITSRASIIFKQTRIGRGGEPFTIYKFRTMLNTADPYDRSPEDDDPRVTKVGHFLRVTGLDELPQLFNVLKGDMSLVGPRPEMPFIVAEYTSVQRRRLGVKPGLTGVWQLSPDRNADIHENIEYDLYYIHHRSLVLDVLIVVETVFSTVEISIRKFRHRLTGRKTPTKVREDTVAETELSVKSSSMQ